MDLSCPVCGFAQPVGLGDRSRLRDVLAAWSQVPTLALALALALPAGRARGLVSGDMSLRWHLAAV